MRILAVIPARGGSKRLPGKNIRLLGGRPLIVWSIDLARGIPDVCDTLVSTDDRAIADVAAAAGAMVPWLRPAELATDTASGLDVCIHALDWYEHEHGAVDGLLVLQPTSPFRARQTVLRGVELFRDNPARAVLGVSPAASHPLWCFQIEGDAMRPFVAGGGLHQRSQDLPPAYVLNGAFYLISPERLRTDRSFHASEVAPLVFDHAGEDIDIDTEHDWRAAEAGL
jgi:CMP-N,N'-diacetyllegionaminic acid synthase